jgi:hypothetical protein
MLRFHPFFGYLRLDVAFPPFFLDIFVTSAVATGQNFAPRKVSREYQKQRGKAELAKQNRPFYLVRGSELEMWGLLVVLTSKHILKPEFHKDISKKKS